MILDNAPKYDWVHYLKWTLIVVILAIIGLIFYFALMQSAHSMIQKNQLIIEVNRC